MTVNEILNKYSKEVIIEWICNRYPVFMNKDIKKELDETKNDLEFNKAEKELQSLFAEQKKLKEKPYSNNVALRMEKNRIRIKELLNKEDKILGISQPKE